MKNKTLVSIVIVTTILLAMCIFTGINNIFYALIGWIFGVFFIIALFKLYKLSDKPSVKIKNQTVVQLFLLSVLLNSICNSFFGRNLIVDLLLSIPMITFVVIGMIRLYKTEK